MVPVLSEMRFIFVISGDVLSREANDWDILSKQAKGELGSGADRHRGHTFVHTGQHSVERAERYQLDYSEALSPSP